jgi:dihydrofolate reductase
MATITAVENVSLDGVMQAPGRPDEDSRNGFAHGGWGQAYSDEVAMRVAARGMAGEGALLLGRYTYELLHDSWGGRDDNPFSARLEASRKYVVSRTVTEPLVWANSTRLGGDPVDDVRALKVSGRENRLTILGSGVLVRALLAAKLVDVLQLSIAPLLLGSGVRLFADESVRTPFTVTDSVTTTTGVVIATYERAGS